MTLKDALIVVLILIAANTLFMGLSAWLWPELWQPSATRVQDWFERCFFCSVGVLMTKWYIGRP